MDRNAKEFVNNGGCMNVALLAEGVDRNASWLSRKRNLWVALLAEGVDRNRID